MKEEFKAPISTAQLKENFKAGAELAERGTKLLKEAARMLDESNRELTALIDQFKI